MITKPTRFIRTVSKKLQFFIRFPWSIIKQIQRTETFFLSTLTIVLTFSQPPDEPFRTLVGISKFPTGIDMDCLLEPPSVGFGCELRYFILKLWVVEVTISSPCYRYGISQTYAKMQLVCRCKRKNEIYQNNLFIGLNALIGFYILDSIWDKSS